VEAQSSKELCLDLRIQKNCHAATGSIEEYHVAGTEEVMGRIFKRPELLFIALVLLAPVAVALLWRSSTAGFFLRLLFVTCGGLAIWLAIIFLIVKPRYRNY